MSDAPRLVIDARPLVGSRTGIGVHTAEIARGLSFPPLLAAHAPIRDRTGIEGLSVRIDPAPLGVIWQQMILPRVLTEERADVLWGPHGTIPLSSRVPALVTVHDLTSITAPTSHQMRTVLSFNTFIAKSLDSARFIAAVSRTTAEAVMRGFGIAAHKIEVIPNGVGAELAPPAEGRVDPGFGLEPGAYLLYAGTIEPRKGIGDLIDAWERLRPRPKLVLCGSSGWGMRRLRRIIERHARTGEIVVTGYVDRASLVRLLQHALLFVYPSHDEGFGLPPLEAMACGTPVVAAAGGAIPEVVGDAAVLVPPGQPDRLLAALRNAMESQALRADLRRRGLERARLFSWDYSTKKMEELVRRAAE